MIPCDPNDVFCDAADEGAALGLLGIMTGISEEWWCAGWMSGLEFALWNAPAGMHFGMGQISERQSQLLKLLSEECDGWWRWDDGPKFIRRAAWLAMLPTDGADSATGKGQAPQPSNHRSEG